MSKDLQENWNSNLQLSLEIKIEYQKWKLKLKIEIGKFGYWTFLTGELETLEIRN